MVKWMKSVTWVQEVTVGLKHGLFDVPYKEGRHSWGPCACQYLEEMGGVKGKVVEGEDRPY